MFCAAAVREDRMPGGRNSGAVYNMYKVGVSFRNQIYQTDLLSIEKIILAECSFVVGCGVAVIQFWLENFRKILAFFSRFF